MIDDPPFFQPCLGIPWAAEASAEAMSAMRNMLPEGTIWPAFGVGPMPMVVRSVLPGGHARVALDDKPVPR